jgi:alkylresorcinol/alkylpyrone synthase
MSSPSVLFVLQEEMRHRPPAPGSHAVLAAFGPGLGIEVALLRFS